MLDQHDHASGVARARQRAAMERARAARAAGIAVRHELLAVQANPTLRDLHLQMAGMHRDIERRHSTAARLHAEHADRLAAWAESHPRASAAPRLMSVVAATVGTRHIGLSLVLADRSEAVTVASDPVVTAAKNVEFTLGEGPVHDVTAAGTPVAADASALPLRWPRFAPEVARLGVRAVAAAPLRTGTKCLGALTVFDPPADLERTTDVLSTLADALVHTALLAPDSADPLDLPLLADADYRPVVHQASGMIAQQRGCSVDDALVLLRARAFAEDQPLAVIAAGVVHRRSRLS